MHCPKCKEKLAVKPYRKRNFHYCFYCEGVWIDAESLKENGLIDIFSETREKTKHSCPECESDVSLSIVKVSDIELEKCPNCLGVFFDKGELNMLSAKYDELDLKEFGKDGAEAAAIIVAFIRFISTVFRLFSR